MKDKLTRREILRYSGMAAGALALASCSAPQATPTPAPAAVASQVPAAPPTPQAAAGSEPLALPIVKQPLTLTYWIETNPNVAAVVKSYSDVLCYQELEKRTGIHPEFQQAPVGQGLDIFNLMIASQRYPDVIEFGFGGRAGEPGTAPGGPARYIKDGVILRLNDLIDKYAPNFKKIMTEHPEWRKQVITDEGDYYGFPFLRGDPFLLTFTGPIIRGDWLEQLKLPVPTTLDEWRTMLKAFKEKDPNGNGKPDELPFTPWQSPKPLQAFRGSGAFIGAWGIMLEFYVDNGVVKHGALQPEFKEFLKTMADWYKEGLIDPDFVSTNRQQLDAKATGDLLGSLVGNAGSGIGNYMGLATPKNPKYKLVGAPYPAVKSGSKVTIGQRDFEFTGIAAAISTANKHVPETVRWLDYAYSPEGQILFNFGLEGVSYKLENGQPKYTDAVMRNPDKLPIAQALCKYVRASYNGPFVQDKRYSEQTYERPEQREAVNTWIVPDNTKWMPRVTPTQDESKRFATITADVASRMDEAIAKIIVGQQAVDSWDQVVPQLKQMGLEEAIKIQQGALERYNKRLSIA